MSDHTRIYQPFEYHAEDLGCHCCLHYVRMDRKTKTGCGKESCRFDAIRRESDAKGRLNRPRGWFRWDM